jgi:MFS family permease
VQLPALLLILVPYFLGQWLIALSTCELPTAHIAGSLSAGVDESTWVLTSYLVSNAIVPPLTGWFSRLLGPPAHWIQTVGSDRHTAASIKAGATFREKELHAMRGVRASFRGGDGRLPGGFLQR